VGFIFKSKEDKELKEYLDELDKMEDDLLSEEEKQRKAEEKNNPVIQLINVLDDDPEDKELLKYLSDKELKEIERGKRTSKFVSIIAASIMTISMVVLLSIAGMFHFNNQDELHRVTKFEIEDYYKSRYGSATKLNKLEYICYKEEIIVDGSKKQENKCTDIVYALTNNNETIMKLGDTYADNISTSTYYKDYQDLLLATNPELDLIANQPMLSDRDFYHDFYKYIDYIKVLPANSNLNTLLKSNKLNIIDTIMYQGTINLEGMTNLLSNLTENSSFVFIKSSNGIPTNVKIMNKYEYYDIDVTGEAYPDTDVTYYQLDLAKNNIAGVSIISVAPNSIKTIDEKEEFINAYRIGTSTYRRDSKDKGNYPSYYLVMLNNKLGTTLREFSSTNELAREKYNNYHDLNIGGKTYIVSNRALAIGTIQTKSKGIFN